MAVGTADFFQEIFLPRDKNKNQKGEAMPALIIILCIVAITTLLLFTKVTLRIRYKESLCVALKILFIKIQLYPSKKKNKRYKHSMSKRKAKKIRDSLKKKPKKERKLFKKKKKEDEKEKEKKKEKKLSKNDILSIISIIISFVKNFIRLFSSSIRLKASRINLIVATDNAASTAITYGAVTEGINVLFPLLDGLKTVKKLPHGKDLSVGVDFLAEEPTIDIEIEIYIRIIRALGSVLGATAKAFKKAIKDQMKRLERKK